MTGYLPPAGPSTGTFSRWTLQRVPPPPNPPLGSLSLPLTAGSVQQGGFLATEASRARRTFAFWHRQKANQGLEAPLRQLPQEPCLLTSPLLWSEKAVYLTSHRPTGGTAEPPQAGRNEVSDQDSQKGVRPPGGGRSRCCYTTQRPVDHVDKPCPTQSLSPLESCLGVCSAFLPNPKNILAIPTQPELRDTGIQTRHQLLQC